MPSTPVGAHAAGPVASVRDVDPSSIVQFPFPGVRSPQAVALGPDRAVWFTASGVVGRIRGFGFNKPGTVQTYAPPSTSISQPSIVAGPDGAMWFTEEDANAIGRVTMEGHTSEFPLPDPRKHGPNSIVAGPDGNLWFTEWGQDAIGRITPDGVISEFAIARRTAHPNDITVGPDGALWFTMDDGTVGRCTVDGTISTIRTGAADAGDVAVASDGRLWFTDPSEGLVGVFSVAHPSAVSYLDPAGPDAEPGPIVSMADGKIWVGLSGIGALAVFRPDGSQRVRQNMPAGADLALGHHSTLLTAQPGRNRLGIILTDGEKAEYARRFASIAESATDMTLGGDGTLHLSASPRYAEIVTKMDGATTLHRRTLVLPDHRPTSGTGIATAPDGSIWLARTGGEIVHETGSYDQVFDLSWIKLPGDVVVAPDGAAWICDGELGTPTKVYPSRLVRVTAAGGVKTFPVSCDPYTRMTVTGDGSVWFQSFTGRIPLIGRLAPDGTFTTTALTPQAQVGDVATGPDGRVWVTVPNFGEVDRIDPATGHLRSFPTPTALGPLTADPGRGSWFADQGGLALLGVDGTVTQFDLPSTIHPRLLTFGANGDLWFTNGSRIGYVRSSAIG